MSGSRSGNCNPEYGVARHNGASRIQDSGASVPRLVVWFSLLFIMGVFLEALSVYLLRPAWSRSTVPGRIATLLLHTPVDSMAPWFRFMCLYIPEIAVAASAAAIAARVFWRQGYRALLLVLLGSYCAAGAFASPDNYAVEALGRGALRDTIYYGAMTAIFYGVPLLCGVAGVRWRAGHARAGPDLLPGWNEVPFTSVLNSASFVARVLVCSTLVLFSSLVDWSTLQVVLAHGTALFYAALGCATEVSGTAGDPVITISASQSVILAECTGAPTFLVMAPFVWVRQRSVMRNVFLLIVVASIIETVNLVRIIGGVALDLWGWEYAVSEGIPGCLFLGKSSAVCRN